MVTITVQRANVILRISPEEKEKYLASGYSVIGEDGTVVERGEPSDVQGLKILVAELKAEISEKDAKIKKLEADLKKAYAKKTAKTE